MSIKTQTFLIAASLFASPALSQEVQHFSLKTLPEKTISELLTRGMISGKDGTIGYFTYKKGAVVPLHQHSNEQYSLITQGSVKVLTGGKEIIVKAGEGIIIPSNIEHSFVALEDNTIDVDFFAPGRKDWLEGTDTYYDKKTIANTQKEDWDQKQVKPEVYATVNQAVGNISFSKGGDLIYSNHPFFNPDIRVASYNAQTKESKAFPNTEWNTPRTTDDHFLSNVLGIRNDKNGVIWMLDMGQRNAVTPKIVGWNTETDQLERIYYLPQSALHPNAQPNDMLIDTKHGVFIIADEGIGNGGNGSAAALIVVDMRTGSTRRLLEGTRTTLPETNSPLVIGGKKLTIDSKTLLVGCDGITADINFEWLYFGPLNGGKLYRVKISDLLDEGLSASRLDKKIENYATKPNNGGLSMDIAGNIYLTAMETNSVDIILAKDRSVHHFMTDKNLLWPDGISYNPVDGYMYVSAAQVHLGPAFNNGKNSAKAPYLIYRFKPVSDGVPFR